VSKDKVDLGYYELAGRVASVMRTNNVTPVRVYVDADFHGRETGEKGHFVTPNGDPVFKPMAYRRAGGRLTYIPSSETVEVGELWMLDRGLLSSVHARDEYRLVVTPENTAYVYMSEEKSSPFGANYFVWKRVSYVARSYVKVVKAAMRGKCEKPRIRSDRLRSEVHKMYERYWYIEGEMLTLTARPSKFQADGQSSVAPVSS